MGRRGEGQAPPADPGEAGSVGPAGASDAWGAPALAPGGAADPLAIPEHRRYERGLELGRGGMGRVVTALDLRLGRQVALKEVHADTDPQAAARLLAEAQLAAGLDHPGIVTVHDAGRDARGQPFYAMRLVRGETLSRAARALPSDEARQRLVQPLIAACHAVGHAHERRIVHRDLKPDNLLVGPHGETQVADWGLACSLAQAAAGGIVGTAEFMAPEVAAGHPATPRSDVYSLGATLVSVLLARDGDLARHAAALPPELRAIAERCLARDPGERYPDAAALAEDLSAWLEGRRVAAFRYSSAQLLWRLVRALRLPLLIATIALLLIAGVAWQGYRRTVAQRDRATRAEQAARRNLAAAYAQAADVADAAGARPEAETLAAAALALGDAPGSRGLLARAPGGPAAALLSEQALPPCQRLRLSPTGALALCVQDDAALLLGPDGATRLRWPGRFFDGAISDTAGRVILIARDQDAAASVRDSATGAVVAALGYLGTFALAQRGSSWIASYNHGSVTLVDLAAPAPRRFAVCSHEDGLVAVAFTAKPAVVVACRSGRLIRVSVERGLEPLRSPQGPLSASAVAVTADGRALLGTREGRVLVAGEALLPWAGAHPRPPSVQALIAGPEDTLAVLGEGVGPVVFEDLRAPPVRLPAVSPLGLAFADARTVVVASDRLRRYHLDAEQRPARYQSAAGLSDFALSPDGRLLAAGGGNGVVTIWRTMDGAVAARLPLTVGVIKSLAFSPDGTRLAVGMADAPGFAILEVGTWRAQPAPWPVPIKELGYFADGSLWRNTYEEGFDVLGADGRSRRSPVGCARLTCSQGSVGPSRSGTALAFARPDGGISIIRQEDPERPAPLPAAPWLRALALSSDLGTVAVVEEARVRLLDVRSRRFVRDLGGPWRGLQRVAFSPDDRLLLVTEQSGVVRVLGAEDGAEVAVLRGHSQRVSRLGFAPGLLTAGWDGAVLRWDAARLIADPAALQAEVAARWGLRVEDALRAAAP